MSESEPESTTPSITEVWNRLDGVSRGLRSLRENSADERETLHERVDELETENEALRADLQRVTAQIEDLQSRTNLLDMVDRADDTAGRQRSAALLQHLRRKARAKDGDEPRRAAVDRDAAEEALHHPDVDRTTIYSDMERVARWIDDGRVCTYDGGVLRLDLDAADGEVVDALQRHGTRR